MGRAYPRRHEIVATVEDDIVAAIDSRIAERQKKEGALPKKDLAIFRTKLRPISSRPSGNA